MQGGGAQNGPITVVLSTSLSGNSFGQARPIVPHTMSHMIRPSTRWLRVIISALMRV